MQVSRGKAPVTGQALHSLLRAPLKAINVYCDETEIFLVSKRQRCAFFRTASPTSSLVTGCSYARLFAHKLAAPVLYND
jgi:hypothetical protein